MKPMIRPTAVHMLGRSNLACVVVEKHTSTHHATHLDCMVLDVFKQMRAREHTLVKRGGAMGALRHGSDWHRHCEGAAKD